MSSVQTTPDGAASTSPVTVEQVPIEDLHPDPGNPRRIEEAELAALTRSIATFGVVDPVLARCADQRLIAGHQRLVAARRAGLTTVPVILLDLTAEDARLLNVALNQIGGDWDADLLARLLIDLRATADRDLTLSGFSDDALADLLTRFDQRERRERPERFDLDEALAAVDREASGIAPGALAIGCPSPLPRRRHGRGGAGAVPGRHARGPGRHRSPRQRDPRRLLLVPRCADAMGQLPGRLLRDLQIAVDPHARRALEIRLEQGDRDRPGAEGERRAGDQRIRVHRTALPYDANTRSHRHTGRTRAHWRWRHGDCAHSRRDLRAAAPPEAVAPRHPGRAAGAGPHRDGGRRHHLRPGPADGSRGPRDRCPNGRATGPPSPARSAGPAGEGMGPMTASARRGKGAAAASLTVEQLPIDDLHPDPLNPRRIEEAELSALTRSIETFGVVDPVLARRADRRVIAGRRCGLPTVPVILLDLSAEDARLLNVALNRIGGEWDADPARHADRAVRRVRRHARRALPTRGSIGCCPLVSYLPGSDPIAPLTIRYLWYQLRGCYGGMPPCGAGPRSAGGQQADRRLPCRPSCASVTTPSEQGGPLSDDPPQPGVARGDLPPQNWSRSCERIRAGRGEPAWHASGTRLRGSYTQ